ncbi:MAG: hypothetical protein EKK48_28645 [Candidatus Melainabacteria bacterium]|nr:MAG: hypothetical protein EKK48_28645 [Candidatus Melainabacteria bacterium]
MTSEKSVNVDEITSINKIKLVVTDAVVETEDGATQTTHSSQPPSSSQSATPIKPMPARQQEPAATQTASARSESDVETEKIANEIANPEKLMRELPVDDFFRVLEQATPEQLQTLIHTFERGARTRGGAAILKKVIEVPQEPRNLMSIIAWWEWRRPLYNLIVGLSGLPSVIALSLFFGLHLGLTVMSGLCYLFFANICYTLGTPAEVVARTCYKDKAETYGPVLLTLGTIFSVILTVTLELAVLGLMLLGAFH